MHQSDTQDSQARGLCVGLAVSRYYRDIVDSMESAAMAVFEAAGGDRGDLVVAEAPGAFELVSICTALAERPDLDAVVALGCVIKGETSHDQWINGAVSQGLASIS
ncbi:MAG: 6,7-dimethyl-8-ribityllumazine synthase, partial [Phycisphaerales bacterium]|nr:6,7-dimethyl-8-ribityllumazine synthase [Phycisphaerales bacterium]